MLWEGGEMGRIRGKIVRGEVLCVWVCVGVCVGVCVSRRPGILNSHKFV